VGASERSSSRNRIGRTHNHFSNSVVPKFTKLDFPKSNGNEDPIKAQMAFKTRAY